MADFLDSSVRRYLYTSCHFAFFGLCPSFLLISNRINSRGLFKNRLAIFNLFHKMIFLDLSGCLSLQLQLSKRRKIPGPHALHDNTRVGCQGCHLCRTSRFGSGSLDIQPPNAVDERYPASIDMENLTLFEGCSIFFHL